jgi:hypothetical protein
LTDTSGNVPVGVNRLRVGESPIRVHRLVYWPVRMGDGDLQLLTK